MEQRWRDLKGLEATISEYEYNLERAQAQPENALVSDDGQSDPGAKGAMAITPVANDTPPASAAPEHQTPASPISHREDELLTGNTVVGVEGEMANLTVSSPRDGEGDDKGASI